MWEKVGENTGLMECGLFYRLNTREQENWVVSELGISVCLLVFCTLCNLYVYSGFFSLVRGCRQLGQTTLKILSLVCMIIIMDLIVQYFSTWKISTSGIKVIVRELSEMIIRIWGFVIADCVREIEDMQKKICNRIAGGANLDLIQWCSNRILGLCENQFFKIWRQQVQILG